LIVAAFCIAWVLWIQALGIRSGAVGGSVMFWGVFLVVLVSTSTAVGWFLGRRPVVAYIKIVGLVVLAVGFVLDLLAS
jgi:hypothetical protein